MSYEKAMRHSRNVRKLKKQARMYMGFDTGGGRWPAFQSTPYGRAYTNVRYWFKMRHDGDAANNRQAIREQIGIMREIRAQE